MRKPEPSTLIAHTIMFPYSFCPPACCAHPKHYANGRSVERTDGRGDPTRLTDEHVNHRQEQPVGSALSGLPPTGTCMPICERALASPLACDPRGDARTCAQNGARPARSARWASNLWVWRRASCFVAIDSPKLTSADSAVRGTKRTARFLP